MLNENVQTWGKKETRTYMGWTLQIHRLQRPTRGSRFDELDKFFVQQSRNEQIRERPPPPKDNHAFKVL